MKTLKILVIAVLAMNGNLAFGAENSVADGQAMACFSLRGVPTKAEIIALEEAAARKEAGKSDNAESVSSAAL